MPFDPYAILASDGPIARRLGKQFELRPQQSAMIDAVSKTLSGGGKLLVEAGTGVGKSFAYLLPAVEQIVNSGGGKVSVDPFADDPPDTTTSTGRRKRVIISTHTIALQEQLIQKDIPLIQAVIGDEFSAVLVKGRGNYVSLRRLKQASEKAFTLFNDPQSLQSLYAIEDWAAKTHDGTLATLPALQRGGVWDKVQSDSGNCMGKRCATYARCFFQQARRRMENADLLVTNHALFFADLALRSAGAGFLPPYDHVILDEAHTIEDVASDHFGLSMSEGQVRFLLHGLYQPRNGKGFLPTLAGKVEDGLLERAFERVLQCESAGNRLFDDLLAWQESRGRGNGRITEPNVVENEMTGALQQLSLAMKQLRDHCEEDEPSKYELSGYVARIEGAAAATAALIEQTQTDSVYWMEVKQSGRSGTFRNIALQCSPIDVGPLLKARLFEAINEHQEPIGVVLTSATLATVGKGAGVSGLGSGENTNHSERRRYVPVDEAEGTTRTSGDNTQHPTPYTLNPSSPAFAHIQKRLGCEAAATLQLGSPFDYQRQAQLIIEAGLPEPSAPDYFEKLCPRLLAHIDRTDGGAFVLFTSFNLLRKCADWLRSHLQSRGMPMLASTSSLTPSKPPLVEEP